MASKASVKAPSKTTPVKPTVPALGKRVTTSVAVKAPVRVASKAGSATTDKTTKFDKPGLAKPATAAPAAAAAEAAAAATAEPIPRDPTPPLPPPDLGQVWVRYNHYKERTRLVSVFLDRCSRWNRMSCCNPIRIYLCDYRILFLLPMAFYRQVLLLIVFLSLLLSPAIIACMCIAAKKTRGWRNGPLGCILIPNFCIVYVDQCDVSYR